MKYKTLPLTSFIEMRERTNRGDDMESLRQSIATLMREEMEKLMAQMRNAAMEAIASGSGAMVRPQAEGQRGMQYHRVTKIEFPRFEGEDVRGLQAILQRFGLAYDDSLAEIKKVKHVKSVQEYIDEYDKLLCRVELSEEQFNGSNPTYPNSPKPVSMPTPNSNWRTRTANPNTAPIREQLTQRELKEKRAKNLAYDEESCLKEQMLNLMHRFTNRFTRLRPEINWLRLLPHHPLIDYGRYALERMTCANMRNVASLRMDREELLRSMQEKQEFINNYNGIPVSSKPTANTSGNKKNNMEPTKKISNSNPSDVLNSIKNDIDLGTNRGTSNLVSKEPDSSGSSFWNVEITLMDDEGELLKKVDYPNDHDKEDEVASVDNDMACSIASIASEKVCFGTNSLLEQWRDIYEIDDFTRTRIMKICMKVDYPNDHDNEDEVASVDNDMARSIASDNVSFGTNSLLEQ
ncbi:hypothetical protein Tco_0881649 [Tanacetum coccineum]